jgi:hypothetical protein
MEEKHLQIGKDLENSIRNFKYVCILGLMAFIEIIVNNLNDVYM